MSITSNVYAKSPADVIFPDAIFMPASLISGTSVLKSIKKLK